MDYYRTHHRVAINQLEASSQDNQRLEQEMQSLRKEMSDYHRQQEVQSYYNIFYFIELFV